MSVYAVVVVAVTVGFALLAVFARDEDVIRNFDLPVALAIQGVGWPAAGWLLTRVSDLGFFPYDAVCVALISFGLFALRLRLEAVAVPLSTILAGELGNVAKDLVQRARPTSSFVHMAAHLADYSFPSGHVIFGTVLFGTTFWIVWIVWRESWTRNAALACLAALIVLMGLSRVYLGAHWPTDVVGAYCLAGLWVAGTVELILVLKPRLSSRWIGRPFRRQWKPLV